MKKIMFPSVLLVLFLFSLTSLLALDPVTVTYTKCYSSLNSADYDKDPNGNYILYEVSPVQITWSATPLTKTKYLVEVKVEMQLIENIPDFTSTAAFQNWKLEFYDPIEKDEFVSTDAPWHKTKSTEHAHSFILSSTGMYYLRPQVSQFLSYEAKIVDGSTVITPPQQIIFSGMHVTQRSGGLYGFGDYYVDYAIQAIQPDMP